MKNYSNSEQTDNNHAATKHYVDSLSENGRNRRDLSTLNNCQDNEIDNKNLTTLDSITFTKNPT